MRRSDEIVMKLIEEMVMIDSQGVMMISLVVVVVVGRVEARADRMMIVLAPVRQFAHHHHHHHPIVSMGIIDGFRFLRVMMILTIEAWGSIDDGG